MSAAARAGLAYALAVFGCGFALGTIRTLWLAPRVGALTAVSIEVPLMVALSWWLCGWALRRFGVGHALGPRLVMAATAFAVAATAEVTGARLLGGLSVGAWLAQFATPAGLVGLAGQLAFVALPLLRRGGVDSGRRAR